MKPQLFAMTLASLGVMAIPDTDVQECQEERMKPWKGDIFTFESPTSNQTCDSVTITFPDGDPSKMFRTNISGNIGPCAKPEQVIALPSDISGLMRLDWQCADRLPSPCRIITVKDESRPGLGSNATASFASQYFPYHNDPIHGCAIEQSAIEQSAVVRRVVRRIVRRISVRISVRDDGSPAKVDIQQFCSTRGRLSFRLYLYSKLVL
ncbi:hypothetical protein MY3296_009996 [Beauveria thailandica]